MAKPEIVSAEAWQQARDDLLVAEKEATHTLDALAARRRRLPMVAFRHDYRFETIDGTATLLDFFGDRQQLAVYQFMDNGPDHFCPGCTFFTSQVPGLGLDILADADVSWRTVSDMPVEQMQRYWAEKGFEVPFASSRGTSFSDDTGADGGFMLSLFLRDGSEIYRTYATTSRGVDRLNFVSNILDLAAYGRQQEWEDSPPGWPQHPTYG